MASPPFIIRLERERERDLLAVRTGEFHKAVEKEGTDLQSKRERSWPDAGGGRFHVSILEIAILGALSVLWPSFSYPLSHIHHMKGKEAVVK